MLSLFQLDPLTYRPSQLHSCDRIFRETNCYVDIWIELLNALGVNASSMMAFSCFVDFEGDQWTFFKPPPDHLFRLYGIDVHEMQLYRPAEQHIAEQLERGRTLLIEVDAYYLPDTVGTSYRREHPKTSIAVEALDPHHQRLRYFHGTGYHELQDEDYRGALRVGTALSEEVLPPYVELVRFDAGPRLQGEELRAGALWTLQEQLTRKPLRNPWHEFGTRVRADLKYLLTGSETDYHKYAFATVRQCGAAFEAASSFIKWLDEDGCGSEVAGAFERQALGAKAFLLKLARRKEFDPTELVERLASDWELAMSGLERLSDQVGHVRT